MPILPFQAAYDPRLVAPERVADPARIVMEDAPVAHEEAARRMSDDIACGEDAIAPGGWWGLTVHVSKACANAA